MTVCVLHFVCFGVMVIAVLIVASIYKGFSKRHKNGFRPALSIVGAFCTGLVEWRHIVMPYRLKTKSEIIAAGERLAGITYVDDNPAMWVSHAFVNRATDLTGAAYYHYNKASIERISQRAAVQHWISHAKSDVLKPLNKPVIIVGGYRTGTTILQQALGMIHGTRVFRMHDLFPPVPPRKVAAQGKGAGRRVQELRMLLPIASKMHPWSVDGAEEDAQQIWMTLVFDGGFHLCGVGDTPGLFRSIDWRGPLQDVDVMLRIFSVENCPSKFWVLKTPAFLGMLPEITLQWPDARLVWTHRSPKEHIASLLRLLQDGFGVFVCNAKTVFASRVIDTIADQHRRAYQWRNGLQSRSMIHDVFFEDLVEDPFQVVRDICEFVGEHVTDEFVLEARTLLARPRHNVQYALEDYGVTEKDLEDIFIPIISALSDELLKEKLLAQVTRPLVRHASFGVL